MLKSQLKVEVEKSIEKLFDSAPVYVRKSVFNCASNKVKFVRHRTERVRISDNGTGWK